MKKDPSKPDKNVECPPYTVGWDSVGGCLLPHKFIWKTTPLKQYRQEVCRKCGATGRTEKL